MANYLKLGEKAEVFFDPETRTKIVKGQVVEFSSIPKSKRILKALKNGHLEKTTQEEFLKSKPKVDDNVDEGKIEEKSVEFFNAMTKAEIIQWAKDFGFNDDDMAELEGMKKAKMPQFMVDTLPEYEDDTDEDDTDEDDE